MRISTALTAIGCLTLASTAAAQTSQTYVYDVHGRAVAATRAQPGATSSFTSYTYDAAANRTTRTGQTFSAPATPSQMASGEQIVLQQSLPSADYRFQFSFQADGNLVVWFGPTVLWHAGTYGTHADFLAMQTDGNLVLYGPNYSVIWTSGTGGHPGARLVMQSDGNLVIFDGATPIWSTGTGGH
jgi:YD repeat-containing protein